MLVEIFLLLLSFIFIYKYYYKDSRRHLMPPGPWEIPFIGNKFLSYDYEIDKLQKSYGDIFMTKFGCKRIVYLTDFKIAKEVLSRPEFANRPHLKIFYSTKDEIDSGQIFGVFLSNDSVWNHNRRFLLRHLKDLGMGKSHIEGAILYEAQEIVKQFQDLSDGKPHEVPFSLNLAILNVIWQMIASHRYDLENKEIQNFMTTFHKVQAGILKAAVIDFFPVIEKIFPKAMLEKLFGINDFIDSVEQFNNILRPFLKSHLENLDAENPVDLMDAYLSEMQNNTSEESSHFSEADLLRNCYDMFVAGSDTTSNMMRWIILYLAKFQEVQKKLQEIIDDNVPRDQLPGLQHRSKLCYLDAIISEVSRHCSFTSFGLMRAASQDTTIKGYYVPKNTVVISVASFSHNDTRYWNNPEKFNPSRFLDENGKLRSQINGYQPFGLGRRQCLGESMAKMELFIFIGALFQNLSFSAPPGEEIDITPVKIPHRNKPNKKQKFLISSRL